MKILHITECYGAGVGRAIDTFTGLTPPNVENYLLYEGDQNPSENPRLKTSIRFSKSLLKRLIEVNQQVKKINPDIVYAHSSWGGLYARLGQRKYKVVYQPHCFAFEDTGKHRIANFIFWLAEKILSCNTRCYVVLSPREEKLANSLHPRIPVVHFPNFNSLNIPYNGLNLQRIEADIAKKSGLISKIAMLGRIAEQKDPKWFISVKKYIDKNFSEKVEYLWIGDGDSILKQQLLEEGVKVTGWLDSQGVEEKLKEATVYLHSAKYEGFPIAVLDAMYLNLPVVAQKISAYEGTPIYSSADIDEAAEKVIELITSREKSIEIVKKQSSLLDRMNQNNQHLAIKNIIKLAEK